jgi:hypothetical protein
METEAPVLGARLLAVKNEYYGIRVPQSHAGRNAKIVSALVIAVIIILGFFVNLPVATAHIVQQTVTSTSYSTAVISYPVVYTQTVIYTTSSTREGLFTVETIDATPVWDESDVSLYPLYYVSYSAYFGAGTDVKISWRASGTANVYVFSWAEYVAYTSSGTTSPSVASDAAASGTIEFGSAVAGAYYLVIENPNNGLYGAGSSNIVCSTSGSETFLMTAVTYIAQVVTHTTSSQTLVTQTLSTTSIGTQYVPRTITSATTRSCSFYFWAYLTGPRTC